MKIIKYPKRSEWAEIVKRPVLNVDALRETVKTVLDRVKAEGDKAVMEYEMLFDRVELSSLKVSEGEMQEAKSGIGNS